MAVVGLHTIAGIDEGVFTAALVGAELHDWCALQQACSWSCAAVITSLPVLKQARAGINDNSPDTLFQCCETADVTGLWARVEVGEELVAADGVRKDSNHEDTLLHVAVRKATGSENCRMFRWLASRPGVDVVAQCKNMRGQTVLHVCSRYGNEVAARWFLSRHKVDKDAPCIYESTPLLDAVREEHTAMVRVLLEYAADVNAFMPNCHGHGETPLILAVRLRNEEITKILAGATDIDFHQKSIMDVPFANEALDFTPVGGSLHQLLQDAIDKRESSLAEPTCHMSETLPAPTTLAQQRYDHDVIYNAYWSSHTLTTGVGIEICAEICADAQREKTKLASSILADVALKICSFKAVESWRSLKARRAN